MAAAPRPYDYQVRVVECSQCEAPVVSAIPGGPTECARCFTVNPIAPRPAPPTVVQVPARADGAPSPYAVEALPPDLAGLVTRKYDASATAEVERAWKE